MKIGLAFITLIQYCFFVSAYFYNMERRAVSRPQMTSSYFANYLLSVVVDVLLKLLLTITLSSLRAEHPQRTNSSRTRK